MNASASTLPLFSELSSSSNLMPYFEVTRLGSEENIFLPKRAHPGDAGHDVRVSIETALTEEVLVELCSSLFDRVTNPSFLQTRMPLLDRKPIIDPESLNKHKSWGEWVGYVDEQLSTFKKEMTGKRAVILPPGESTVLPAGFKVELPLLPEPFTMSMKIVGRSGWAGVDRLCIANSPGVIDATYRSEVFIAIENRSKRVQIISDEARVAQALFEIGLSLDTRSLVTQGIGDLGRGGKGSTGTH